MTYSLPTPEDLLDWIRYGENQCPECEGEAKCRAECNCAVP